MQTNNNVSFKAIPLSTAKIPMKAANNVWTKAEATFVRFNPRNREDMNTIRNLKEAWNGDSMTSAIVEQVEITKDPVYALVLQQKNDVKVVDPNNVLGMFTADPLSKVDNTIQIHRMAVRPVFAHSKGNKDRAVKKVGTSLIQQFVKFLKENTYVRKLKIETDYGDKGAMRFLKKQHIPNDPQAPYKFELTRDKF